MKSGLSRIDYDEVTAVDELSLQIEAGQIYGFVGPNGAGKTSTIKALAGVLEPTCGEMRLAGQRVEAKAYLENAVKFGPNYSLLYYYLGRIYLEEGDYGQSREMLGRAVQLFPANKEYRELLAAARQKEIAAGGSHQNFTGAGDDNDEDRRK